MENRPPGPEEQDDSTSDASSKKRWGESTLSRYLSRLRGKEQESDGESDTGDEKPKRLRRIFKRLFPSVVEKPDHSTGEAVNHGFDPEKWFSWTQYANSPAASGGEQPIEDESAQVSASSEGESAQLPAELPDLDTPPNEIEDTHNSSQRAAGEVTPEQDKEATVPVAEVSKVPPMPEATLAHQQRQAEAQPDRSVTTNSAESAKEVVIERGVGNALPLILVGAEYLARKKADRKLEKRVSEQITTTNQEVARAAVLQQELETLTKQNKEQLESLKRARAGEVRQSSPPAEKVSPSTAEQRTPPPEVVREQTERVKQVSGEKLFSHPHVPEREMPEEIQPQKILEQVADAAEHNLAVERVFERSHEVKDDRSVPGVAASVGAVMAAQASALPQRPVEQTPTLVSREDGLLPFVDDQAASAAYRRAMKTGFWSAVMIIILGLIAYLVVK